MMDYLDCKDNIDLDKLKEISKIIKNGGIVVFPTETVYGTSSSHGIFAGCLKHLDLPPGQARGISDAVLCADLHLYGGLSLHLL